MSFTAKITRPTPQVIDKVNTPFFQAKLTVNEPNDVYEQEADAVADRVMRMPDPATAPNLLFNKVSISSLQRKCASCEDEEKVQRKESEEEEPPLQLKRISDLAIQRQCAACGEEENVQRKETGHVGGGMNAPSSVSDVISGGGQPLDANTRQFMESRMGQDFSDVQIHTDNKSAASAQAINALAYTSGKHVVFNEGQYQPASGSGKRLLAHELVHVGQQGGKEKAIQRQVDLVNIDCSNNTIDFQTSNGGNNYGLNNCNVTPGTYNARVRIPGNWYTDERGRRRRNDISWNLVDAPANTRFDFGYTVGPNQTNPTQLFNGQNQVRVVSASAANVRLGGIIDIPLRYSAIEVLMTSLGVSSNILATGSHLGMGATSVLRPQYWMPMIPRADVIVLDRVLNQLPRDLYPLIQTQAPTRWLGEFAFAESELASIPSLVQRLNQRGVASLTQAELAMLRRAAEIHIGGTVPGSPLVSYMTPNAPAPNVGNRVFRVRIEVPQSSVLDVSGPNAFNEGIESITNASEHELMLVANHEGRVLSIQSIAEAGSSEAGFLMRNASTIRWAGRGFLVASFVYSGYRISQAASGRERAHVTGEEVGGQSLGIAGTALATAGCIGLGIATAGWGLFACGLVGGLVGGIGGRYLGGAIADSVSSEEPRTSSSTLPSIAQQIGTVCPNCHSMTSDRQRPTMALPPTPFSDRDISLLRQWLDSPTRH